MDKLRSVRFRLGDKETEFSRRGWFHCWSGLSEYPTAVIEDEDGACHQVESYDFLFDPPFDKFLASLNIW